MGFLSKALRILVPKSFAKFDPLGASVGLYGKQKKDNGADLAAQQSAATAAQASKIEGERKRIADERAAVQGNMQMRQRGASRRRVRGGLFGDTTVDQNVQARLG